MQASQNTSKGQRLWAALIFFTRLPLWRIYQPPVAAYQHVVEFWPLTGWLTAGVMAGVLYAASLVFTYDIAILLAIVSRLLLTGALHEDGLADFFDGFGGGGNDRQRILDIMKDSHIGTYGVLALVVYLLLLFFALRSLQPATAALTILTVDPFAKMLSAQLIWLMPYARTEATAKNKTVYQRFSFWAAIGLILQGLLPIFILFTFLPLHLFTFSPFIYFPISLFTFLLLCLFIWRRLRGYTGDCCGALFLLTELAGYLTAAACFSLAEVGGL
jgi:adenosylcobinamide-GDP ribazoletransferase